MVGSDSRALPGGQPGAIYPLGPPQSYDMPIDLRN
jgi:hypothetical protein